MDYQIQRFSSLAWDVYAPPRKCPSCGHTDDIMARIATFPTERQAMDHVLMLKQRETPS